MKAAENGVPQEPSGAIALPTAEASDAVLEAFKRDLDLTLVEKNLRLTTEQRAQQLANVARFIRRFRPLVREAQG